MTISPLPVPNDRPSRARYDWAAIVLNEWQCWLDTRALDLNNAEAMRRATRVRLAGASYARSHSLQMESRRTDHGRTLDLRFTRSCPCDHECTRPGHPNDCTTA